MMYVKRTKILSEDDVSQQIKEYEAKYKTDFADYFENFVKGNEDELDAEGVLEDIEEWGSLVSTLRDMREHGAPGPIETHVMPVPEDKAMDIHRIFTKKRLELLKFIKSVEHESISDIARDLKRDRKSVMVDLNILAEFNFVKLEKHGRRMMAEPEFSEIDIKIK